MGDQEKRYPGVLLGPLGPRALRVTIMGLTRWGALCPAPHPHRHRRLWRRCRTLGKIQQQLYRGVDLRAQSEIQGRNQLKDKKDGGGGLWPLPHGFYGLIGSGPGFHSGLRDLPLCIVAVVSCCFTISSHGPPVIGPVVKAACTSYSHCCIWFPFCSCASKGF